jgi:adenylate cyclase
MSQGERRLAAIMFTDIVGYTAMTQSNESRAMALLDRHNSMLRPFFPRFNGREVKTSGDSFLVEFGSALDALRCAVEIQSHLHGYNLTAGPDERIRLRIGIHLGDVIHRDGDVFGDAVNISSRIEPLAEPGGVCISRQVYDQVRNKSDLQFVSQGERELKNVSVPTEVYSVVMPWNSKRGSEEATPEPRRVAVLPFSNMSPDPADEYFADGMTEELISTVSRIEGAEVISRTSVMQYKRTTKQIREISRELGVGTVLEGSVRKAGNRLRVTVQMIDAGRDRHVWAESYDRTMDDVFAIQSDIAERVAGALKARLPAEAAATAGPTQNLDAYTLYLRALQLYNELSEENLKRAVDLLESAVAADPKFVRAYAKLATSWALSVKYMDFTSALKKGEEAALKALELDPGSAEAHSAMAEIHLTFDRFEEARSELQKAVAINPNLARAHFELGTIEGAFGSLEEATAHLAKAESLDPMDTVIGFTLSQVLMASGKMQESLATIERLIALHPNLPFLYAAKAKHYVVTGDLSKAGAILSEELRRAPTDPDLIAINGVVLALTGRREDAERVLSNFPTSFGRTAQLGARVAIRTALGDLDDAFPALFELGETHLWWFLIKYDPLYSRLWDDPRFAEFCKRVGLPP